MAARPLWPGLISPTSGMLTLWSPIPTSPMTAARSISIPPARPLCPARSCASNLHQLRHGDRRSDLVREFHPQPERPFLANSTLDVYDYASFTNNGAGVEWIPFDPGGTDYHAVTTMVDPLTGLPRLIFGNDQGVWTILDNNGTFETQLGQSASGVQLGSVTTQLANTDRNGNLQITQFYYGATQP